MKFSSVIKYSLFGSIALIVVALLPVSARAGLLDGSYSVGYGPNTTAFCPSPYNNSYTCPTGVGGLFGVGGLLDFNHPQTSYYVSGYNTPSYGYGGYYQQPQYSYQQPSYAPTYTFQPSYNYSYTPQYSQGYGSAYAPSYAYPTYYYNQPMRGYGYNQGYQYAAGAPIYYR